MLKASRCHQFQCRAHMKNHVQGRKGVFHVQSTYGASHGERVHATPRDVTLWRLFAHGNPIDGATTVNGYLSCVRRCAVLLQRARHAWAFDE